MKTFREFVKENYNQKEHYLGVIWWLEYEFPWDYVEGEGMNRHRFDWNGGEYSFWLNDDLTGEGQLPAELIEKVKEKGVKLL